MNLRDIQNKAKGAWWEDGITEVASGFAAVIFCSSYSPFIWDKTGYSKPKNRPLWIMVPTLIVVLALISLAFIWPNLENLLTGISLSYNIGRFYLYAILTLAFSISVL